VRAPLGVLFAAPTVRELAQKIQRADFVSPWTSLVPIQTDGLAPPIFMVHWIERELARHIGEERPIYGLSFGLASDTGQGSTPMPDTLEDLATHYIDEMRAVQAHGPYYLIGHSAGGVVAYEMAQQLSAAGESIAFLGLLDTYAPMAATRGGTLTFGGIVKNVLSTPLKRLFQYGVSFTRDRITRFEPIRRMMMRAEVIPTMLRLRLISDFISNYKPKPYAGRMDFFKSMRPPLMIRHAPPPPLELGWTDLAAGGLAIHEIDGDHMEIVKEPLAAVTAARIQSCLAG
jgi:thioesterase domain-containing protein